MLRSQLLDMDQLHQALKAARRWGVRDSRLESHVPRLIELLYPAQQYPDLSVHHRAMAAENLIKAAISDLGGEVGHLSAVLFGVDPATSHLLLQQRRGIAAQRVGVLPATWHRGRWERQLLSDLAATIYRLHHDRAGIYIPEPADHG